MQNETVSKYLTDLLFKLTLPSEEKEKINNSVKAIRDKLIVHFFDDGLKEVKTFGSFDRDTLLSRKIDDESDVDILIVFDEKKWEPQTYLQKLKQFANDNYPRSENYQDHPTIVIELNHIKFELTPCIFKERAFLEDEKYLIPKKENSDIKWIKTEPNYLKEKISEFKNTREALINLIHIFKYLNLKHGSSYKSFDLEKYIIDIFDYSENLSYNFFRLIDKIYRIENNTAQAETNKIIKKYRTNIEYLLEKEMEDYAIMELKKLLPE